MTIEEFKTLKIGDKVIVTRSLKDHYGEIWHEKGESAIIKSFTTDGVGVMFEWSDLGLNYKHIEKEKKSTISDALIRGIKKVM